MDKCLFFGLLLLSIGSAVCKSESATAVNALADSATLELPLPVPPDSLPQGEKKINYILQHFWDTLDFRNDPRVHDPAFLEQNFSNFIAILPYAGAESRQEAVGKVVGLVCEDASALKEFAEVAELYLYEPDSPFYSEELYETFLETFTETEGFDEFHRDRYAFQLQSIRKNHPGTVAANFGYITPDGRRLTLHSTSSQKDILLVFYNPDCENCHDVMKRMRVDPRISELTVIAVYSGDNYSRWKATAGDLPSEWIVGYEDGGIEEDELYYFRSMPTMYLLDPDKRVLRKDVQFDRQ